MKTLYVIPARGGSKGLPRKNIKLLNGKPLICYTIEAVREVASDEDICVSTDDIEIKNIVESHGLFVPFMRPGVLSTDTASTEDVIKHALSFYKARGVEYDIVVLLQPTSPLRKGHHIHEALELYTSNDDMVVSAFKTKSNPYYLLFEEDENGYLHKSKTGNFSRRQDCPNVWELNGAIYVINVRSLINKGMANFDRKVCYEMDPKDSIDIDEEIDFLLVELIINRRSC
ncbi:MAG: acylneuraminate cytidylyltransferase family protein [Marinilabiliaceae bacterium]|nr:acylneuraminate cytidylyltransferase family protein [Marinilabiliaceae bacterium]